VLVRGVYREHADASRRIVCLDAETHGSYQFVMSAFSPVPPGCPSLP
jgi:hypothetical protein